MRKQILDPQQPMATPPAGLDIAAIATALVSSEAPDHPIDHAFDGRGGPGASRWIAAGPGDQTLILALDTPQTIRRIGLEIEEPAVSRAQELSLSVSRDGGRSFQELLRQEYNFSPPGTTCEREEWTVNVDAVTHLRQWIRPDKGGAPCRASLTALRLA